MLNGYELSSNLGISNKKKILVIDDHVSSPHDYETELSYSFIVAKSIYDGLNLLKYSYKILDAIIITEDIFNPAGLIAYILTKYKPIPIFLMTDNEDYLMQFEYPKQLYTILPPFDINSIKIGLKKTVINCEL